MKTVVLVKHVRENGSPAPSRPSPPEFGPGVVMEDVTVAGDVGADDGSNHTAVADAGSRSTSRWMVLPVGTYTTVEPPSGVLAAVT